MSNITLIIIAALGLSLVSVLLLIWRSEEGHEDEKGFHPGADEKRSNTQASDDTKVKPPNVTPPGVAAPLEAKR